MGPVGVLVVTGTGLLAGSVNTVAGAGSLLTFPVLVAVGLSPPALARRVRAGADGERRGPLLTTVTAISVCGGYFGTGIGVLFFAALGVFVEDTAPRLNATKQLLALVSNGLAGVLFAIVGPVDRTVVLVLGLSSAAGGPLGAWVSRRVAPGALRATIAVIGAAAAVYLGVRAF